MINNQIKEKIKKEAIKFLKGIDIDTANIVAIIAHSTKKNKESIIKAINERTILNSEEAKSFGLVDEIKDELFPKGANLISIDMK